MKKTFHFIGICGVSMSGLAVYLKSLGHFVQGSDNSNYEMQQKLKSLNIKVFNGHNKNNIGKADVIVYNFAISQNNPELKEAKRKKLQIISRAELLGEIAKNFNNVISVAGSHGKTTTTAMIYSCLKCANLCPTLHIGGQLINQDFGFIIGKNNYLITEACEYKDSFLKLNSTIAIILNIEPEHLDYFKNFKNEINSFINFANNSQIIICNDNNLIKNKNKITFGKNNSNIIAKNIKLINKKYNYDVFINDVFFANITLGYSGKHNILNSLAVIYACHLLKIDKKHIIDGLKNNIAIKRRYEIIDNKDYYIVHDYAHHPTEIEKTIQTFKSKCNGQKILLVFQPHTFTRTKALFYNFIKSFNLADYIMLAKTYSAREKFDKQSSSYSLYKTLKQTNKNCSYFASFNVGLKKILKKLEKNYAVLILGAGDIDTLAYNLKKFLNKESVM